MDSAYPLRRTARPSSMAIDRVQAPEDAPASHLLSAGSEARGDPMSENPRGVAPVTGASSGIVAAPAK